MRHGHDALGKAVAALALGRIGDSFTASASGDLDADGDLSMFSLEGKIISGSTGGEVFVAPNMLEVTAEE